LVAEDGATPDRRREIRLGDVVSSLAAQSDPRRRQRPSLGAVFSNWATYQAPFGTKLHLVVSNNLLKLRNREECCGNHGQPGC
jgi:hypothetical protein